MKVAIIAVAVIATLAAGFIFAAGPEPHIVIPGDPLWEVGPLTITSTLMASWFTMLVLIVLALVLTRGLTMIPSGKQNFVEASVGFLLDQMEEIAGREHGRRFFMVIATFFLFILMGNWLGLLPFFKAIGITHDYGTEVFEDITHQFEEGEPFHDDHHYFAWEMENTGGVALAKSGADTFKFDIHEGDDPGAALDAYIVALAEFFTDYEAPEHEGEEHHYSAEDVQAALAALEADPDAPKFVEGEGVVSPALGVSFAEIEFPGTKLAMVYPFLRAAFSDLSNTLGMAVAAFIFIQFWGFQSLGFGYLGKFFINPLKNPIMTFVGFLELLSEFIRVISFSFRLFGNIFAGSVLLLILTFLAPFIAPLGIYALEMFVGLIQAVVFSLLLLVFAIGAVTGHDDHDEEHGEGHGHGEGAEPHHQPQALQAH